MRIVFTCLFLSAAAFGQVALDSARIPARLRNMEKAPDESPLACSVKPISPVLDFSFRFEAGYVLRVPMRQYEGKGHGWAVLLRIAPDDGGAPVYLGSRYPLPEIPKTGVELEVGGGFVLGEGTYHVQWKLVDDTGRVCHASWTIHAMRNRAERSIEIEAPPDTIRDLSTAGRPPARSAGGDSATFPATILLNAAPVSPRRTRISARDRLTLIGLLSALLNRLPSRSVRVVVFSLDQQREIYRQDSFEPRYIADVGRALDRLELGKVDVGVLENRKGHVNLLANLLHAEMTATGPSRAVLVVGPESRFFSSPSAEALEKPPGADARFFYLQYEPPNRLAHASLPDSIAATVHRLKGKTLIIRTPADLARAIDQVKPKPER